MKKILINVLIAILVIPALPFLTLGLWLVNIIDDMEDRLK